MPALREKLQKLWDGFVRLLYGLVGLAILLVVVWWFLPNDWSIKYAAQYMIDTAQVTVEHKPHNCDWDSAPIGSKHCRYEAVVTVYNKHGEVIEWGNRTDPAPIDQDAAKVHVGWQRVED